MRDPYEDVDEADLEVRLKWDTRPDEGWGIVISLSDAHIRLLAEGPGVTSGTASVEEFPHQVPLLVEGMPELFDADGNRVDLVRLMLDGAR